MLCLPEVSAHCLFDSLTANAPGGRAGLVQLAKVDGHSVHGLSLCSPRRV